MTAPTFRSNSAFQGGTGSVTMALPAGYQANDILVLNIETSNSYLAQAYTNLTNNGWARPANSNVGVGTAAASNTACDIWWKRAAASETAVVLGDFGNHTHAVVAAFENCVRIGTPWQGTINVVHAAADAQVNSRGVQTNTTNSLICVFVNTGRDAAAAQLSTTVLFNSSDEVETTERYDWGTVNGDGGTLGLITYRKPTPGLSANLRANLVTACTAAIFVGALQGIEEGFPFSFSVVT
jgi:hypothetical protein